ncbi:hypothetical protein A9979_03485 [Pseudomonas sp. UMC76]|nr:hypothetical protein [Pseudomonas sp. UMC76]
MHFLDYCNEDMGVRDGLLERLVAPFVPGRGTPPDTATRHLPYRKLFKVFDAAPEKRPALMAKYLDEWYHASRREPYIDQHGEGDISFYGYWSWEAAAVTWLLNIDDSSYRDKPFYPRDLVDLARRTPNDAAPPSAPPPQVAGTTCSQAGFWSTSARHGSRRYFVQGELFPAIPSDTTVGVTQWDWDPDQSEPIVATIEPARAADSGEPAPRAGLWLQAGNPQVRCRMTQGQPMPEVDGQTVAWTWTEQPPPGARAASGQPCPYPGIWHCEDQPIGPKKFRHNEVLPSLHGRDVTWFLVQAF